MASDYYIADTLSIPRGLGAGRGHLPGLDLSLDWFLWSQVPVLGAVNDVREAGLDVQRKVT